MTEIAAYPTRAGSVVSWAAVTVIGSLLSLWAWSEGLWTFLDAWHPWVISGVAGALSLWLLFALSAKITLRAMRLVDLLLPRGDAGVPLVGALVRSLIVLLGPSMLYVSLMGLREETRGASGIAAAIVVGVVVSAVSYQSVALINIMRIPYLEDEVRKGILDTGVYNDQAIRKLEQAVREIATEFDLDKKRIRLRRLAATDRVLRNKNYDPHQIEHGTTTAATVAGQERERHVRWAQRNRLRIDRQADLEDTRVEADIAETESRRRAYDLPASPEDFQEPPEWPDDRE